MNMHEPKVKRGQRDVGELLSAKGTPYHGCFKCSRCVGQPHRRICHGSKHPDHERSRWSSRCQRCEIAFCGPRCLAEHGDGCSIRDDAA